MAGVTIRMTSKKQYSLQKVYEKIQSIEDIQQVSKSVQEINGVTIWSLVFEKFYFISGGYTTLTVVLTEYGQEQTAYVVTSSGEGMVNISLGANRKFAKACVLALESSGFAVIESDLDKRGKGIVERFFE